MRKVFICIALVLLLSTNAWSFYNILPSDDYRRAILKLDEKIAELEIRIMELELEL